MAVDEAVEKKSRRRRKRQEDDIEEQEQDFEDDEPRGLSEAKGRATPSKRSRQGGKKEERGNFIVRSFRGVRNYLGGVQDELDKVVWPTREEMVRLTRIVTMVTVASAIMLGAIAFVFTELFILGLDNEWLFLAFGVVVAALYLFVTRVYLRRSNNVAPPY
ncbi:MAG: preprotein translocase subunit SecE [Chloroflexota bacterium]